MSLLWNLTACRQAFARKFVSTPTPSLRLAAPRSFASWVARELGHSLAFGGAPPKFFSGFHMVIHCLMKDFAARPPGVRPGMPPGYSPEPVPSARP